MSRVDSDDRIPGPHRTLSFRSHSFPNRPAHVARASVETPPNTPSPIFCYSVKPMPAKEPCAIEGFSLRLGRHLVHSTTPIPRRNLEMFKEMGQAPGTVRNWRTIIRQLVSGFIAPRDGRGTAGTMRTAHGAAICEHRPKGLWPLRPASGRDCATLHHLGPGYQCYSRSCHAPIAAISLNNKFAARVCSGIPCARTASVSRCA